MNEINNQILSTDQDMDTYFKSLPPITRERRIQTGPRTLLASIDDVNAEDDIAKVSNDAPAVIAFSDGLSDKNRSAVMLSIQFAETVANNASDIDADPIQWLKEYERALKASGWVMTGGREFGSYSTKDQSLTMEQVVMELLGAVAGPNKATVIALMGQVLDKLGKNDSLMKLFENNSQKGNLARFRIMPCLESAKGVPVTYLLAMHCQYSSSSGGALFWKWKVSNMNIRRLATGIEFNLDAHEATKQLVINYLRGEAEDFFSSLKKQ